MKLNQFINRNKIRVNCEFVADNPNMAGEMPQGSFHFKCTLKRPGRQLTTFFSMGPAHSREPSAADLLDCLASDASGYENARGFEEWASEYGYDPDSRRAEKIFRTVEKQTEKLKRFMGDEYETLLYHTERL